MVFLTVLVSVVSKSGTGGLNLESIAMHMPIVLIAGLLMMGRVVQVQEIAA